MIIINNNKRVKMTMENIPSGTTITSLLDYGCAEGAITAVLGCCCCRCGCCCCFNYYCCCYCYYYCCCIIIISSYQYADVFIDF